MMDKLYRVVCIIDHASVRYTAHRLVTAPDPDEACAKSWPLFKLCQGKPVCIVSAKPFLKSEV